MGINMKKVLVYAGYKTINYGSALQAFATVEMLRKLNAEPVLLNLNGLWKAFRIKKTKFYLSSGDLLFLIQSKGRMYYSKIYERFNLSYGRKMSSRRMKFNDFIQTQLILTEEISELQEAAELLEEYDVLLLGSDQIWLPSSVVTDIYTLNFARDKQVIKIAYAPSFGINKIPEKYINKYQEMFNNIDHISVREESGKKIVEDIADIDCPVVADPVLMLDRSEWEQYLSYKRNNEQEYIFIYLIGNNRWQREWIKKYAVMCNMRTVALIHLDEYISYDRKYFDQVLLDESPIDFFNWIRNAELVFTDSYHCMLFSLIENKNVWCFRRFDDAKKISTNSRLYTILQKLQIEERLLNRESRVEDCLLKDIDFIDVNKRISGMQQKSWDFLRMAINNH